MELVISGIMGWNILYWFCHPKICFSLTPPEGTRGQKMKKTVNDRR
jgi:hypothetical protein